MACAPRKVGTRSWTARAARASIVCSIFNSDGRVQTVAGLDFHGCGAKCEHRIQALPAVGDKPLRRRGARRPHGAENASACGQDVKVGGAVQLAFEFVYTGSGKDQMRVGIDEAGADDPAAGIQGAPAE